MAEKENNSEEKLKRELGLGAVVFFIFGYVVGAGILIQTGVTAGETGPALWLAFIIAGIPNAIMAIIICYIASAVPVSGGAWVYSSRLASPFAGYIVAVSIVLNIVGALALLALGFGTYFEIYIPESAYIMSIIIIIIFFLVNLFGVKFASWVQIILAILGDFLVIFIFIIFGLPNVNPANLVDAEGGLFPNGIMGIFLGAIILSFSYAGFQAVIEIGGEIKNPRKNIPRAIIISLTLVTVTYILISIVMTGVMNWQTLGETEGTLIDVGALFFPPFFLNILNIMILIAIASTIHGIILAYSRDLYSAARDHILPSIFAKVHKKYGTPYWALIFFTIGACLFLVLQASIIDLSIFISFAMTIPSLIVAYIPLKLRKKYPELVEKSKFKLSKKTVIILSIFNISYNVFSMIIMIGYSPIIVIAVAIFYGLSIIYYFYRVKMLKKKGIDIKEICKLIPEEVLEV